MSNKENGVVGSGRAHPSGAIPKISGDSKFHTSNELSFEDNFNPSSLCSPASSITLSSQLMNNHIKETPERVSSQPANSPQTTSVDGPEINEKHPRFYASPLMCYVVRLKRGDELRKSLLSFAKKNGLKAAFIMTCVGSATSAKVRVASAKPDNEANYMLDIIHPTEIVSLEGTLSAGGHLHVALSDSTGKICGGHLLELTIDTTAEVVIGDCSALSFSRIFDNNTGFHELNVCNR